MKTITSVPSTTMSHKTILAFCTIKQLNRIIATKCLILSHILRRHLETHPGVTRMSIPKHIVGRQSECSRHRLLIMKRA